MCLIVILCINNDCCIVIQLHLYYGNSKTALATYGHFLCEKVSESDSQHSQKLIICNH